MAFLSRLGVAALSCLGLGSCASTAEVGNLELYAYSGDVRCDSDEQVCHDADGDIVPPEPHRRWAFVSTESSVHDEGVLLYFELLRGDGARAVVELDVPLVAAPGRFVAASFIETRAGEEVFHSETAVGRIELPSDLLGEDCPCPDGRFELTFLDVGADAEAGTDDDDQRTLSSAVFGSAEGLCLEPAVLPAYDEGVAVSVIDRCPSRPERPPPTPRPRGVPRRPAPSSGSGSADCSGGEASCDGDGCESDSSSGGCESDSSSGGCEGDSSSGGCEGDSSSSGCDSSDTTCEGDAAAAPPTLGGPNGCRGPTRLPISGRAQLLLLFALAMLHLRYRARGAALPIRV